MEVIKKIFKVLYNNFKESDLESAARLSKESVMQIAALYGEEQGWFPELVPKPPYLAREWKKLCWTIYFDATGEDHRFKRGGNIFIVIDDETGKVVRKSVQNR